MSNEKEPSKKAAAKSEPETPKRNVRVSITQHKTRANGMIYGKGAQTLVTADQAKALEAQGRAVVIGV